VRRLHVTASGKWYIALTIALGVVALVSANNVLYLIESLLLSGLILSGVLSERAISAVRVDLARRPAEAGSASRDRVRVTNERGFPLFCVEVGEWRAGRFVPLAYIPRLAPRATGTYESRQVFGARGRHRWDGLAVATSYPFGFARKFRVERGAGERLVWPAREKGRGLEPESATARQGQLTGIEIADGEVRPYAPDDDCRLIVWPLSARGGEPLVRMHRSAEDSPDVILDARCAPGPEFERRVRAAAQPFYRGGDSTSGMLVVLEREGPRRFHGQRRALDALALIEAAA
jgi:uncharacterized protein (DUF58 family)